MYALLTFLARAIEACTAVVSKKVREPRKRRAMQRAEPISAAGEGPSREVSGRAVAAPTGPLTAPLSGEPCVWYAVTVLERFHGWRPGPLGPVKVTRHVKVAGRISGPLYISGDATTVRVETRGADLELGDPEFSAFEGSPGGPLLARLADVLGAAPSVRHARRALGFVVEERYIAAGDALRVVGQAREENGELVLRKPSMRPFVVARTASAPRARAAGRPAADGPADGAADGAED